MSPKRSVKLKCPINEPACLENRHCGSSVLPAGLLDFEGVWDTRMLTQCANTSRGDVHLQLCAMALLQERMDNQQPGLAEAHALQGGARTPGNDDAVDWPAVPAALLESRQDRSPTASPPAMGRPQHFTPNQCHRPAHGWQRARWGSHDFAA
jgi:hypothetical protein